MIRRTCACGATIACADLDGYDIWLEPHPTGWIDVDGHDHATVGAGPWRRHTCAYDPRPLDLDKPPPPPKTPGRENAAKIAKAARRDIAAAQAVLDSAQPISGIQRRAALLRINNPGLSIRQIAASNRINHGTYEDALARIRRRAQRITNEQVAA